ncbi:MAG: hypothetical protein JWN72_2200 [Thermoleophilia bacterium]|nr:hypothetical protein [Thermoleophilia bacterium]
MPHHTHTLLRILPVIAVLAASLACLSPDAAAAAGAEVRVGHPTIVVASRADLAGARVLGRGSVTPGMRYVAVRGLSSGDRVAVGIDGRRVGTVRRAPWSVRVPLRVGHHLARVAITTDTGTSTMSVRFRVRRLYPLHTRITATTFWVGEQFQQTADGSQACSAYDSRWQYSYFRLATGVSDSQGCAGAPTGGCDALLRTEHGPCDDVNAVASLRTPANDYRPAGGAAAVYENPFYLDLPYDDYNPSDATDTTGFARRCRDVPWAGDPGYAGHCTDADFSYLKNRWVRVSAHGRTCYGQVEDAGPADDGHGNGNYADAAYVFGHTDIRPFNRSYGAAGMDVSPALGACLGGTFNEGLVVSWRFVDLADVPLAPFRRLVTTSAPN